MQAFTARQNQSTTEKHPLRGVQLSVYTDVQNPVNRIEVFLVMK